MVTQFAFTQGPTGAATIICDGHYWDPMDERPTVSFYHHSRHIVTIMFADWETAGRESSLFIESPDVWILGHFETRDDDNRAIPRGPDGRPQFVCAHADWFRVLM